MKTVSEEQTTKHHAIRSFVRREGRMTAGQKRALSELLPRFDISQQSKQKQKDFFDSSRPVELEIGCGNGDAVLAMAESRTEHNFLAVDVHRPGIGKLLIETESRQLTNIGVSDLDINILLTNVIPDGSLFRVMIFFPDPWHKKKHHKRRLIQVPFLSSILTKLIPSGELHIATDWQDYADHIVNVLEQIPALHNVSENGSYTPRPTHRPETRFERRGLKLGHEVFDIITRKSS